MRIERKMDMWVPLKKKDKHPNQIETDRVREVREIFFLFFSLFIFFFRFMEIGPLEFVGSRTKVLYATKATHGYQKHGILPRIQVKIRKNPNF